MHVTRLSQPSSPGGRILLRVNPWERVQFYPAVRAPRPEAVSRPAIPSLSLSEAHVSERHAGCRQCVEPSQRTKRASSSVRLYTTAT